MKSFLSLERPATFTCIKNGRKRKYLVYEGSEFVNYELILDEDTDEESGVECKIFITDWQEKQLFINKSRQKLAYYDTVILIIDKKIIENSIKRTPFFQWSTLNNISEMHLCLKDVMYIIDWEALGIKRITIPIALRFELDSGLKPTPSRESYITNEAVKKLIINRIEEVATYLTEKYNETVKEPINFLDAFSLINKIDKVVLIDNLPITIDEILGYSQLLVENIKIEGFKVHTDGKFWKSKIYSINHRYKLIAKNTGEWKTKRVYTNIHSCILDNSYKIVKLKESPRGKFKDYLKDKHKHTYFITINEPSLIREMKDGKWNDYNYTDILNLKNTPVDQWEALIDEWKYIENLFDKKIIDETVIEGTIEYNAFLLKREENHKEFLKNNPKWKNPNHLNKGDGDITLALTRLSTVGINNVVYEKKVYPINTLHQLPHVIIYSNEDNKVWLEKFQKSVYKKTSCLKSAIIGKREVTKLPNLHNFISMDDFLTKGNKQFRQIATAELISDAIDDYKLISNNMILNKYLLDIKNDIDELLLYINNYHLNLDKNDIVYNSIMAVAKDNNLWDNTIMPTFEKVLKNIETLRFASFLKPPKSNEEEKIKEFNKLINQFLLFRKIHNGKFDNYEIVKIVEPEIIAEVEAGKEEIPFLTDGENAINQIFSINTKEKALQDIDEDFDESKNSSDDIEAIMAGLNNPLEYEEKLI